MVATTSPGASAETVVQEQRLPQLLDDVARGALCASAAPGIPKPDDWYRDEDEDGLAWRSRSTGLFSVCAACPVRAACAEAALRQGEGSPRRGEEMVRAGMTGAQLHAARVAQTERLADARREDDRARSERLAIQDVAARLHGRLLLEQNAVPEYSNSRIRGLADDLAGLRAARRRRAGWNTAA